ncbi:MAG TPA: signal peptidase II, partial [Oleiagrimonas sp.]|nr:signal peptidase II [Oleiagrimonas sp.]
MTTPKPSALSWLWLSALTIFIDQLSKFWVLTNTAHGAQIPVIDGFLYRTLVFNRGAAFSFLA